MELTELFFCTIEFLPTRSTNRTLKKISRAVSGMSNFLQSCGYLIYLDLIIINTRPVIMEDLCVLFHN